jgi:hypothetical protein
MLLLNSSRCWILVFEAVLFYMLNKPPAVHNITIQELLLDYANTVETML